MKALIIEDEPLARKELRLLLEAHPEITIVGEAISPRQAAELVEKLGPDLLFVDVNLRGGTGFDFLDACGDNKPKIIFITAHPDFAVQAFDFAAVDYLLKPIRPERLALAIHRVTESIDQPGQSAPSERLTRKDRIFLRDENRSRYIPLSEIRLIESEGNYSRLHFGGEALLVHRSLSSIEERLPTELFFRANRSQIVNLESIVSIEPWFSNCLRATLADGTIVEFSRRATIGFRATREL